MPAEPGEGARDTASGLDLRWSPDLDAEVASLLLRDLEAILAPLAAFGRFSQPLTLLTVDDQQALAALAEAPVDGPLCAAATPTRLVLLRPCKWPRPPADHVLRTVLCHELAHALLFQRCAPPGRLGAVALPSWFREGMAVVASEGRPSPARQRQVGLRRDAEALADADALAMAQQPDAVYAVAAVFFDRWLQAFGDRRLATLCRAMRQGRSFSDAFAVATSQPAQAWLAASHSALRAWATDSAGGGGRS